MAEIKNRTPSMAESFVSTAQKLEDGLKKQGLKIKQHETNLKTLTSQRNRVDDDILEMQVALGKYHSSRVHKAEEEDVSNIGTEEETIENILREENSAAAILYHLKARIEDRPTHLSVTKDVIGIVATLGKVDDENLSRLLSEFVGKEKMLAVVCKTYDGVKALEEYDEEGSINKGSGLHGLGASVGRQLDDPFHVICLDSLSEYVGDFIADDPQRRLDLLKPRLPNGEIPPGFLGFAVNMIDIDNENVFCVTTYGHGLRETLFYSLFSRVQVYRSRVEMMQALPLLCYGAISLDGGMIKDSGVFYLGNRKDVVVKFPKSSGISNHSEEYYETERRLKVMKWKRDRMKEDTQREQALLDFVKFDFELKKEEYVNFIAHNSPQQQMKRE